jgi:hypothetical protein
LQQNDPDDGPTALVEEVDDVAYSEDLRGNLENPGGCPPLLKLIVSDSGRGGRRFDIGLGRLESMFFVKPSLDRGRSGRFDVVYFAEKVSEADYGRHFEV